MLTIVSTGFEGPEREALEVARILEHPWRGYAPAGRSGAFDTIPERYFTGADGSALVETTSSRPAQARYTNAREADATLVLCEQEMFIPPIGKKMMTFLRKLKGQYKVADPLKVYEVKQVVRWICTNNICVLNICADPRKPDDPFTKRSHIFLRDIVSYTDLHENRGVKIWT
jgi:hypothetical protein